MTTRVVPFAVALTASGSLLAPTIGYGQAQPPFPGNGVPPNVYFADETADVYEKTRCDDEQTIVYFSNGVATDVGGAVRARNTLDENLDTYLKGEDSFVKSMFGDYVTAIAFTETGGGALSDTFDRVVPDDALFYEAQRHRFAAGLDWLPEGMRRREAERAIAVETELLANSEAAGKHAAAYDALLGRGRGNVVVGHSYGTILANASYYGIQEHNRPGHALVQTALMSTAISGADRFSPYPLPYTTIHEDAISVLFPRNKLSNVDNFDNDRFPGNRAVTWSGHNFIEDYLNIDADLLISGSRSANDKIMSDIVAMQLMIQPRPCHGHILGGAAVTIDDLTGRETARQLSYDSTGDYAVHPSREAGTAIPTQLGPTKLVDWRGQFGSDGATEVLAYSGPGARYNGPAVYGSVVYRWGEIAYKAPGMVLGAAIQHDAGGRDWIVVASHDRISPRDGSEIGDTVTLWRRDARHLDGSSTVFDAQTNPDGWRRIGVITLPEGFQSGPWFFNGNGTEAASIRIVDDRRTFSAREEDPGCLWYGASQPMGFCVPGPSGFGAAYPLGERDVKEARLYTVSVPLPGSGGAPSVSVKRDSADAAMMAVDYDDDVQLVLREENVATDRGYLDDPDPASLADFRWLTINGVPLTDAATLGCSVDGTDPCRWSKSAGMTRGLGGFASLMGDLAKERPERIAYHVFYADLRTRTYAFSRREGDRTEYWLAHGDDAPTSLGTETGLPTEPFSSYAGSRYGYEGDYRNLGTDAKSNRQVERNGALVPFGKWPKVNPILGRYETQAYDFQFSVSPPPTFGIDVAVDGSVLVSGVLPGGATFNYHSRVDLEHELGMPLAGTTLLPIGVR